MTKPLAGIRVLDLTNVLAGPFCCYQLALMGADVIKIEMPERGDLARELGSDVSRNRAKMGASFIAQNAGKRSLTLNLKCKEGRCVLERLVAQADILIENFRPGVMSRLGLGYEHLKRVRPSLVYGAISGFGQTGPMAGNPAYDQIVQGLSGAMSVTGDVHSSPLRVGFPIADTMGGITAAFAVTAALVRANQTGEGEFVDVSMLDSTLASMAWAVSNWLLDQEAPQALGNENITASPSATFHTGEGLLNISANKQEQFERLCELIGRPDLVDDPQFADREERKTYRFELRAEIEKSLQAHDASHWAALFNAQGIPAGEVLTVPEILAHAQIEQRDFVHGFDNGDRVATGGYMLGGKRPKPERPPPRLGENSDEILREYGFGGHEIDVLKAAGVV